MRKKYLVYISIISFSFVSLNFFPVVIAETYTFASETINKGYSINPANKNAEDSTYNTLVESDQYSDTNYSGSSESMTYGTTGGGSFPSALDTDDSTRRNYIEANIASANSISIIRPTADSSVNWDTVYPPSPTTHYTKIYETNTGSDSDTTYITTATSTDRDVFTMGDISPTGSPIFDIRAWVIAKKASGGSMNLQFGIVSGGTDYSAYSGTLTTSYLNYSAGWLVDPKDSVEWTTTKINALTTYMTTNDIVPVPYVSQIGIIIYVNYTTDYEMQGTITYSSVSSTSQTTGYQVICQGYRSNSENFYVQAWNYTSLAWVIKTTINSAGDTNFNFNLLGWSANCERSSGNEVKLRLIDVTGLDVVQDTLYLDLLKICRIEIGYALDIEITASSINQYGNEQLGIKAYTSTETFNIKIYNWLTTTYDSTTISIVALSNTWYYFTIDTTKYRSGSQTIKIQFLDGTSSSSDQTQDTCYLDIAKITWIHSDPTITSYRTSTIEINIGENAIFWLTYTDIDNEIPTYIYTHAGSTDYSMTGNNSGDTTYYDGKLYGLTKSDLTAGNTTYYFKVKDANSGDITTSPVALSVNTKPTLTLDGVNPSTGAPQTFTFFVTYYDADSNSPKYIKVNIATVDYVMTYNGSGGGYHYDKYMAGGNFQYYFLTEDYRSGIVATTPKTLVVNNPPTLTNPGRIPADPIYKDTQLNFTITYNDADNQAPTSIKWREDNGTTQNITMFAVSAGDTNYIDGKDYYILIYLNHDKHWYDYYTYDGLSSATTSDYSLTISNRNPTITDKATDPSNAYRNVAWSFDFNYSDLDEDSILWTRNGILWLDINDNGILSGTTTNTPRNYVINIWANDSYGGSATYQFTLNINNRNPTITDKATDPSNAYRNVAWNFDFNYSDADGDSMSWTRNGISWLNIDSNGILSGTTINTPGNYVINIWANDSYGGSATYQFTLNINNRNPTITDKATDPSNAYRNIAWSFDFNFSDADGDSISWARNGISWLNIDSNGILSGTTTNTPGNYVINIWANDSYGGSATYSFHLIISNRNPIITSSGNITQEENTFLSYKIIALDLDSDTLTYELWTNASWASIENNYVNGTAIGMGWYIFHVWANDSYSGIDYEYWSINVTISLEPFPPYFTSSPELNWFNNTYYEYNAIAHDPNNDELTFDLEGNASFLSINPTTGMITGTPILIGYYLVNVSVNDGTFTIWQNYTLTISIEEKQEASQTLITLVICTVLMLLLFSIILVTKT